MMIDGLWLPELPYLLQSTGVIVRQGEESVDCSSTKNHIGSKLGGPMSSLEETKGFIYIEEKIERRKKRTASYAKVSAKRQQLVLRGWVTC